MPADGRENILSAPAKSKRKSDHRKTLLNVTFVRAVKAPGF